MFSFHKPRIYRSTSGCCICRAKSSSSRFTDSRRYEGDFYACFRLSECRTGDICNACVLLVKRWKKLPRGSQRNWHHVVDARAGHGSKPISKINKVKKVAGGIDVVTKVKPPVKELSEKMRNVMKKHINPSESFISTLGRTRAQSPSGCSDDVQLDCISSESGSYHSSLAASPTPSEVGEDEVSTFSNSARNKKVKASSEPVHPLSHQHVSNASNIGNAKANRGKDASRRSSDASSHNSFLDLSFWKREKTCCGIIFKGPSGEVLLDRRFLSPCFLRSEKGNIGCRHSENLKDKSVQRPIKSETCVSAGGGGADCQTVPATISVDCISVDSGYDDSSNSTPEAFKPQLSGLVGGIKAAGCIVVGKPVHISSPLSASYIQQASSDGPLKTSSLSSPLVTSGTAGEQSVVVLAGATLTPVDSLPSSITTTTIQCGVLPTTSLN